jgi:hypothetical protein
MELLVNISLNLGFFQLTQSFQSPMALESARLLTEISTRNLPVGKMRPALKVYTSGLQAGVREDTTRILLRYAFSWVLMLSK